MDTPKKSVLLALFLTMITMLMQTKSNAQDASYKTTKYEIAMDLQNLFSEGYPEKVLFKINNIKDNQIKGAYRLGLGAFYWVDKYKITHDDENYTLTAKKQETNFSLSVGYEFQKRLNRAVFYYGADLGALYGILDEMDIPHFEEAYNLFLVPFAGIKVLLSQNLSIAFETGIKN
jgi:predicted porin